MNGEPQATIRRQVAEYAVGRVQLWFTDVVRELEMVEIPSSRLDGLLDGGGPCATTRPRAGTAVARGPTWSPSPIGPPSRSCRGVRDSGKTAAVFCSLTSMGFVALDQHALA